MKEVYILVHEMYSYWDGDYSVELKTFTDRQSAINFLQVIKEECLDEVCKHEDKSPEELREDAEGAGDYVYSFIDDDDYFKVDVEEYGFDEIYIERQDVMQFII